MKNNIFYCVLLLLVGCSEPTQEIEDVLDPNPSDTVETLRAIVVNEGQFGYGTASITTLSNMNNAKQDVFRKINDRPLGDVAQSLIKIKDYYYVPLNNSKKVEVFDSKTFKSIETLSIDEDVIPMYAQYLGGDSIAVTDQKSSGRIMIMDINHGKQRKIVRRTVPISQRSFQMIVKAGKLFVGGDQMLAFTLGKVESNSKRIIRNSRGESIKNIDFSKIVEDKNGLLWVISAHTIYSIDPVTEKTINEINISSFHVNDWVGCIDKSPKGDTIYFNSHRKVYAINVDKPSVPESPIIDPSKEDARVIYNMSVSKENTILFCEVLYGSLSRANIFEYDPRNGKEIGSFKAGLFPHYIYFE